MTENSDTRSFDRVSRDIFVTIVLWLAFSIAGLVWPARDLLFEGPPLSLSRKRKFTHPHLSLSRKRSETSSPAVTPFAGEEIPSAQNHQENHKKEIDHAL